MGEVLRVPASLAGMRRIRLPDGKSSRFVNFLVAGRATYSTLITAIACQGIYKEQLCRVQVVVFLVARSGAPIMPARAFISLCLAPNLLLLCAFFGGSCRCFGQIYYVLVLMVLTSAE